MTLVSAGCSIDASIDDLSRTLTPIFEDLNRKAPDLIHGEVVTTTNGYRMTAVFGEISEKQTTSNGWSVDGVFYE